MGGYGCQLKPFDPRCDGSGHPATRPTDSDCWQTSYRWHMEFPDAWGIAGKAVIMLCIVEDRQLGQGQVTEQAMAASMEYCVSRCTRKGLWLGKEELISWIKF